jgi:hypothetical protein
MQAKEWTRTFGRCNPVEHAVTKQQSKHECTGKSPIQLFVRVLKFVVQNHLRLSHPPRLFCSTKHILIPLKVHTPNNICVPCYRLKTPDIYLWGECSNHVKKNYKSFHQEEGIIVVQAIIDNLRGGTRFPSLLGAWRRTWHHRRGTPLFSLVAWGPHEARL